MATNPSGNARPRISLVNTLNISQRGEFLRYARDCAERNSGALQTFRNLCLLRDRSYSRQLDITNEHIKAARGNLAGDARKLQNMAVPIVMPQVESAVAYQAGVYLTSYPIFGVVSAPENMSQAQQFETVLGQQSQRYGWTREMIKIFRNAQKYNFGAGVCLWETTPLKAVVTDSDPTTAGRAALKEYKYGGNRIRSIDVYNCFQDMTVSPSDIHTHGEYFGWNEVVPRIMLKRMLRALDSSKTTQATEAFNSRFAGITNSDSSGLTYYRPVINRLEGAGLVGSNIGGGTNWGQWAGLPGARNNANINCAENYLVTHFLCRAAPADFGAPGNDDVVFYGIIVNWNTVVYVEQLNVGHDYLPAFVMQPNEDGLGYQTQSMADNAAPFQDMSSALWNATLESKRRAVFDRLIYNPRFIDKKDIDPVSSVARIPLRNAIMAKDGNEMARAIYQIPYRDENASTNLQMSEMISGMADQATGQNKVDRGQFQPGNKTRTEFTTTMQNSNSRQQLSALAIQGQFMTPLKEVIKSNVMQFQTSDTILNREKKQLVKVDPVQLRQAILEFQLTDGMLSSDKMMSPELLMVFLQTAQSIPTMATEYDIMGMFMYWAKLQGAVWLDDFKRNPQQQQQFLSMTQQTMAAQNPPVPAPPDAGMGGAI